MLPKVCIILFISLDFLSFFSRAQYPYFGVRNVNQVEPPSLESSGLPFEMHNENAQPLPVLNSRSHARKSSSNGIKSFSSLSGSNWEAKSARKVHSRSMSVENNIIAEAPSLTGWKSISKSEVKKKCAKKQRPRARALSHPQTRVLKQAPKVKMIDRKKEEGDLKEVERVELGVQNQAPEERQLKPNLREKIETYTEQYLVTTYKTRIVTRKRLFMQKRKMVNQRINKPIMIVRRKLIKERQVFERIIPKIIEERVIVNRPEIQSKVIEGPIIEITEAPKPEAPKPEARAQRVHVRALVQQESVEATTTPCPPVNDVEIFADEAVMDYKGSSDYLGK